MQTNPDIIAIYSRKSRFTGKGESITNQVDLCRAYIRTTFGAACADHALVFEDEGFSGGSLDRPDFQRMLTAAKAHQFKAVVVYRLDRISRSISDFSQLIETLGRLHIDFISIREQFDTASPMGRAMMYIASVFSQLERETIAERIRDNMHALAKTGRWLGGVTPTGYTAEQSESITIDGKRKHACHLKLIPSQAELVHKIFDLYTQTDSLTQTEAALLRQHIKTKTGRDFTRFSIRAILQNPVYLIADPHAYAYFTQQNAAVYAPLSAFDGIHGILTYHRTHQEKGRAALELPISEWIVSVGQHLGIISSAQWIAVQHSLMRNRSHTYRKPRSNTALLTGLLRCSCGSPMYPKLSQRTAPDGTRLYSYVCKQKANSKRSRCNAPNINGNELDGQILQALQDLPFDRERFCAQLRQIKHQYQIQNDLSTHVLSDLQRQRAEIGRKIDGLIDSLADTPHGDAASLIQTRIETLHNTALTLDAQITAQSVACAEYRRSPSDFAQTLHTLTQFDFGILSVEEKRRLVRLLISEVIWDGQTAVVILHGTDESSASKPPWCEDRK